MVAILIMSTKLAATLGLLKVKDFWKKCYDNIIYVHDLASL